MKPISERARALAAEMFAIFVHPAPTPGTIDAYEPAIARAIAAAGRALAEQPAPTETAPECRCARASMGSTFCAECQHDLGCPVHMAHRRETPPHCNWCNLDPAQHELIGCFHPWELPTDPLNPTGYTPLNPVDVCPRCGTYNDQYDGCSDPECELFNGP
jgi:hypothetical protein